MKKILILGSGGREHALAHTFFRQGHRVFCHPGNAGTEQICEAVPVSMKHESALTIAEKLKIDLTVVGPEDHLAKGISDIFTIQNKLLFGPSKRAAQLESSKAWAKEFMKKYSIPTARFKVCYNSKQAQATAHAHFKEWNGLVIKPSGLTAGKGVTVCGTIEEALNAIEEIMDKALYGDAGKTVIVEERLFGKELSLLAFCDGVKMIPMIPSQDHKNLYEGDKGPNTGGIGAYAPTPFVSASLMNTIRKDIVERTNTALQCKGLTYRGILYFGIMLTDAGPKVLEYNCRFGDPEAQAILPLLQSDLYELMLACLNGDLKEQDLSWSQQAACCVVMASAGYPHKPRTGEKILGLNKVKESSDCLIFHAGTTRNSEGSILTAGGRVLGVTGLGNTLQEAVSIAYKAVDNIAFKGAHYRRDIAYSGLLKT
jgi:phosphoribosylamine---glycine ligase